MDRLPDRTGPLNIPPRYLPYGPARELPNLVVDGAPLPSTVLTLSHWPNNRSPAELRRDTSTATAFAYLDSPSLHRPVPWVTTNHFDEDGLFSMFAVSRPAEALVRRELLVDASFAGDFGVVRSRDAARLCFIIEGLCDQALSPLPATVFTEPDRVSALYRALLETLPTVLDDVADGAGRYRDLWAEEEAHLEASRRLLATGQVTIQEIPEQDLAVVRAPARLPPLPSRRYLETRTSPLHPLAVNTATSASRLLLIHGASYVFEYRYESWVQLATRRVPLRVSLNSLAARLNSLEPAGAGWIAEDPADVVPRLWRPDGSPSALDPDTLLRELNAALHSAPVAWDPYDWPGEKCA